MVWARPRISCSSCSSSEIRRARSSGETLPIVYLTSAIRFVCIVSVTLQPARRGRFPFRMCVLPSFWCGVDRNINSGRTQLLFGEALGIWWGLHAAEVTGWAAAAAAQDKCLALKVGATGNILPRTSVGVTPEHYTESCS